MKKLTLTHGSRGFRAWPVLLAIPALVLAYLVWGLLRLGAAPEITIAVDRAAVGTSARVVAHFREPRGGLGALALELVQGDRTVLLGESQLHRAGALTPWRGHFTPEATLEATIGTSAQDWLREGEVVLRARADRMAGQLRSPAPIVVEKRLPVRLRPPRLELISSQHYVRQGGAGVVVFRIGDTAARSGVRAGTAETLSYPKPGGTPGERFALYALPWDLEDYHQIVIFAEDDAGNRAELPFIDIFKKEKPRSGTIEVTDDFLARVVPAIASQTPGFDTRGDLLEQYLRINGEMRRDDLTRIEALTAKSADRFFWSGAFLQMSNTALRANFAEQRTYSYKGKVIDHQVHLGLDLASLSHAPVPAPNAGVVLLAGWLGIYGNAVLIDHGYGLATLCGHMSALSAKAGDAVTKGQTIGSSGSTGLAGGDHLHLEVFVQGRSVNPVEWLDAHWIEDNLGTKIALPAAAAGTASRAK